MMKNASLIFLLLLTALLPKTGSAADGMKRGAPEQSSTNRLWVSAYYDVWQMIPVGSAWWAEPPDRLDYTNGVTHIIQFPNGNISAKNPFFGPVAGVNLNDSLDVAYGTGRPGTPVHFRDSLVAKAHRNNVRVLLCINAVCANELIAVLDQNGNGNIDGLDSARCDTLTASVAAYLQRHKYDGVDINIENGCGSFPSIRHVGILLRRMRHHLDLYQAGIGGRMQITLSPTSGGERNYPVAECNALVDQINPQTYDNQYTWNGCVGANVNWYANALYPPSTAQLGAHAGCFGVGNLAHSISGHGPGRWAAAGFNKSILGVGISTYGRVRSPNRGPFQAFTNDGYAATQPAIINGLLNNGGTLQPYDSVTKSQAITGTAIRNETYNGTNARVNAGQGFYYSYPTPQSVKDDIEWIAANGYSGIMLFDYQMDCDPANPDITKRNPLIHAAGQAVGGSILTPPPAPVKPSIRGQIFYDADSDGVKDPLEAGMSGWRVELRRVDTSGFSSTLTYENGTYAFDELSHGTYKISEVEGAQWRRTRPAASDTITVAIATDTSTLPGNYDFGNYAHDPTQISTTTNWAMLSLPLAVSDARSPMIFPSAQSLTYGYEADKYFAEDSLVPGRGYWIRFTPPQKFFLVGAKLPSVAVPVETGWNLVGSSSQAVGPTSVSSVPAGIVVSKFFSFSGVFKEAASIIPGYAYWVKTSGPGLLTYSGGVPSPSAAAVREETEKSGLNTLTISRPDGLEQTLFFGMADRPGQAEMFDELPPIMPGIFDVRFLPVEPGGTGSLGRVVAGAGEHPVTLKIRVESPSYPLRVTYKLSDTPINPVLVVNGAGSYRLGMNGEVMIAEPVSRDVMPEDALSLIVESGRPAGQTPEKFELSQNYPNPFNPVTHLEFRMPVDGRVRAVVYNTLAQQVAVLVNGDLSAGTHLLSFDGAPLPSGMYICVIEAKSFSTPGVEFTDRRKMVLVK